MDSPFDQHGRLSAAAHPLVEYFKCPGHLAGLLSSGPLAAEPGYFRFRDATCYGRQALSTSAPRAGARLTDVSGAVASVDGRTLLPFDLSEVVRNLRYERYPGAANTPLGRLSTADLAHAVYYFLRPALPVAVRKHLQRLRLRGWQRIAFPRWPVDMTVDTLMREAVGIVLKEGRVREVPFIWFWPDGAEACITMTHDVEGPSGAAFISSLMDLDETYDVKSSFQLVPQASHARRALEQCSRRGFEVNVHDLNHDGHLFRDKATFDARVTEINRYGREFGSRGFRSGAMYRRQDWFSALEFAYDMSVPTVAHFEPQQGGCCTVMPYFIGDLLELPLTTTQDYALFHYLGDYSIDLWKSQMALILANHGLVSFIAHPDYLVEPRAREVYEQLLKHISRVRAERHVWVAMPSEIDRWWRARRDMTLVPDGHSWRVEGPGSERARVAYARLQGEETICAVAA